MEKRRTKLKMTGLLLTMVLLIASLGIFSLTASAAAASDLTVTIDTGASVTLQDADGNGFYDIGTADELYAFAAAVNDGNGTINGELTADIVVNENVLDENGELNGDGSNFRVWTPIGLYVDSYDAATVFHGQFNGNNHTVSGLYFNDETKERAGLFGCTNGATINGIGVLDCYINGKMYVGGVVGYLRSGTLENCYNTGSVLGSNSNVGGVAGWAGKSSTVQNCFNTGNVSSTYGATGGVVGYIYDVSNTTTLENCYNTGNVVGLIASYAQPNTGGVIGSVGNNTVENCFFLENTVTIEGKVSNGSVKTGTQAMSFAQFASGEVAHRLGSAFGQILTGDNRQSYPVLGGTPVTDSERFEIYGRQLNLGGDLSMKYYVAAYAPDFDPEQLQMKFIHNGVVTTPEYEIVDGFYVFTLEGINPQCMGDSIDAYVYYDGVQKAEKLGYTVEKNLTNLLAKYPDDAALVTLVNDILAYGEAASAYKEHNTMTGKDYADKSSNREIPDATVTPSGAFTGYTVVFGQVNFIKIRVTLKTGYTLYLDGTDITSQLDENGIYRTNGIAPTDFDKVFTFTVKNGDAVIDTYEVSVNSYASAKKDDGAMGDLVKALYNYGMSAEIYNHAKTGEGEHTFDSAVNNGDTHTKACACGESITEGHSYDGNGECICGATIALVSTLDDLKAAIQNGGEYMLGDNIQVPEYLAINTEFILHLNGKKLIGAVEDDVVLWGGSTSNVTILGDGVLTNSEDAIIEDAIINGTIINDSIIDLSGIANIAGGTFLGQVNANYGTCKISGGQIHYMQVSGATCTVNDGKIDSLRVTSTCTVNGGEIKTLIVQLSEGCVTITGGWVENLLVLEETDDICVITGGTFGVDPTAYVDAENYTVTNNGDGTWTVTAK